MTKTLFSASACAALLLSTGSANADVDDTQVSIERTTPRAAVEGFVEACLRGFPDWKRFATEIKADGKYQHVEGSRETGHETWRSRDAVVSYDHRVPYNAVTGAPHCSYTAMSGEPVDREMVSSMIQSALNKHLGMTTQRRAGPGQYGWYWNNGTDIGNFGDNSRIYLLYNYGGTPDDRRISLSLQVRKAG